MVKSTDCAFANTAENNITDNMMIFLFLLFGKIHFIFAINHANFYAFGHLLELIAYTLLLADLIIVVRR